MRFSFAPLVPLIEAQWKPVSHHVTTIGIVGKTVGLLDVSTSTVYRWQENGLTVATADEVAGRLGVHPAEVWSGWLGLPDDCERPGWAAIKRHKAAGERLCVGCSEFKNGWQRDWRKRHPDNKKRDRAHRQAAVAAARWVRVNRPALWSQLLTEAHQAYGLERRPVGTKTAAELRKGAA